MDRATAISRLPEPYAAAVRLHDEGHDDCIAEQLGIDPAGVPTLLRLATAKLTRIVDSDGDTR